MKRRIAVMLTLLIVPVALADIPHTFKKGEPAKASEVNANFRALDDRLDAIEGKGFTGNPHPFVYDYIDRPVGDTVVIGDTKYVMVEMPFEEIISGDRYRIKFPVSMKDCDCTEGDSYPFGSFTLYHSSNFAGFDETFSGLAATAGTNYDSYYYRLRTIGLRSTDLRLEVEAQVYRTVIVKIGQGTRMSINAPRQVRVLSQLQVDSTERDFTNDLDWSSVEHAVDLFAFTDLWLNHVRIERIN